MGPPQRVSPYPAVPVDANLTDEQQDHLWADMCDHMEKDIVDILGWTQQQATSYIGRGEPTKLVMRPLLKANGEAPVGRHPEARAWKWLAQQTAWAAIITGKILGADKGHFPHRGQWRPQLAAAWRLLARQGQRWADLGGEAQHMQERLKAIQDMDQAADQIQALFDINQQATEKSSLLAKAVIAERDAGFRQKLSDKFPGSAGLAHKLVKWRGAWTEAKGSVSKKILDTDPQKAAYQEAHDWAAVWQVDQQQEALWMRAGLQADLGPIGVDKLRQICAAFKPTTGLGVDGWHPRHWSWLSNQALETLECMFRLSEAKGRWPSTAWATLLFLAPKQDGGGRPLGLLPTPIRVWEAARDPIVRDWERTHLTRDYDWTVHGAHWAVSCLARPAGGGGH